MTTRASLHGIVDRLPDDLLPAAEVSLTRIAEFDGEFWSSLLTAREDHLPLTEAERERVDQAWELLGRDAVIGDEPLDELLGLFDEKERSDAPESVARLRKGHRRIQELRRLEPNWDGEGARPPVPREVGTAAVFWHSLPAAETAPSIGPANDGGVVFEWELGPVSLYCYARDLVVEVAAFDAEHDIVELQLPPRQAATLTAVLLNAFSRPR